MMSAQHKEPKETLQIQLNTLLEALNAQLISSHSPQHSYCSDTSSWSHHAAVSYSGVELLLCTGGLFSTREHNPLPWK